MADQGPSRAVPAVRRPRHPRLRRSVPALVMMLVLASLAGTVWWRVIDRREAAAAADACTSAALLDPRTVKVRVYNNGDRQGVAKVVAGQLTRRGFVVLATGNDPLKDRRPITANWAEVRHGTRGAAQARLVAAHVPGVKLVRDGRKDMVVDLALGQRFLRLANPQELARAMAAVRAADAKSRAAQGIVAAPSLPAAPVC